MQVCWHSWLACSSPHPGGQPHPLAPLLTPQRSQTARHRPLLDVAAAGTTGGTTAAGGGPPLTPGAAGTPSACATAVASCHCCLAISSPCRRLRCAAAKNRRRAALHARPPARPPHLLLVATRACFSPRMQSPAASPSSSCQTHQQRRRQQQAAPAGRRARSTRQPSAATWPGWCARSSAPSTLTSTKRCAPQSIAYACGVVFMRAYACADACCSGLHGSSECSRTQLMPVFACMHRVMHVAGPHRPHSPALGVRVRPARGGGDAARLWHQRHSDRRHGQVRRGCCSGGSMRLRERRDTTQSSSSIQAAPLCCALMPCTGRRCTRRRARRGPTCWPCCWGRCRSRSRRTWSTRPTAAASRPSSWRTSGERQAHAAGGRWRRVTLHACAR